MSIHYSEINGHNGILRGFLHKPESTDPTDLFIFFHGFTGSKVDNNHFGTIMGKYFEKKNFQFLRFDFFGSADSDGEYNEASISTEIIDARDIIEYAKKLPDVRNIYLLGHSMGGVVALKAVDEDIDSLFLLAPAFDIKNLLNGQIVDQVLDENLQGYDYGGLVVGSKMFNDLDNHDLDSMVLNYSKRTLVIHGSDDGLCLPHFSEEFAEKYDNAKYYAFDKGDHCFNNFYHRIALFDQIMDLAVAGDK